MAHDPVRSLNILVIGLNGPGYLFMFWPVSLGYCLYYFWVLCYQHSASFCFKKTTFMFLGFWECWFFMLICIWLSSPGFLLGFLDYVAYFIHLMKHEDLFDLNMIIWCSYVSLLKNNAKEVVVEKHYTNVWSHWFIVWVVIVWTWSARLLHMGSTWRLVTGIGIGLEVLKILENPLHIHKDHKTRTSLRVVCLVK